MRHALSLAALATLSPAQAVTYALLDRGQVFGQATAARAINSLGQVVGDTALSHSWIWSAESGPQIITPLNPVAVVSINGAYVWSGRQAAQRLSLNSRDATAAGINASGARGLIVGTRYPGVGLNQAYLYDAFGQLTELGTLGGTYSSGYSVNDRGQAVGGSGTAASSDHAFLWTPGVDMQDGHLLVADGARIAS